MKYDFETLVDRSQNGSAKWNGMKDHNPAVAKNIAPLSVADLDLKLAPEIAEGGCLNLCRIILYLAIQMEHQLITMQ